MELPPPSTIPGPCQYCHQPGNHYPYVCAVEFPWLANPLTFKPPTDPSHMSYRRFVERKRLMAPQMKLGHFLPDWYNLYKQQFSLRHQNMIESHLAEISKQLNERAVVAQVEFGACCIVDQSSLYEYYAEQERRGESDPAFINCRARVGH